VSSTEPRGYVITYSGIEHPVQVLAVVADRYLSAAALTALLLKDPSYRVTRQEHGVGGVRAMLAAGRPQVMVLDVSGTAFFALIDASRWGVRTLLLIDRNDDPAMFGAAVNAGVQGYLSRSVSRETLEAAIAGLTRSGRYLDPVLTQPVLGAAPALTFPRKRGRENHTPTLLSVREREILVWMASGLSSKQIARGCDIAPKTVSNHVTNMRQKLNLRHRGQLVLYAVQQGLTI
jgi:DNA-binding NarL/FixJ family response regulator